MYELVGLVAALRLKGQRLLLLPVGDGGLGGRTVKDRSAETAEVW